MINSFIMSSSIFFHALNFNPAFIHSMICSNIHSLIHSLFCLPVLMHSNFNLAFIHSMFHSNIHSLIHSLFCLLVLIHFTHSHIDSFTHAFSYEHLFQLCLFKYLFGCLFPHYTCIIHARSKSIHVFHFSFIYSFTHSLIQTVFLFFPTFNHAFKLACIH